MLLSNLNGDWHWAFIRPTATAHSWSCRAWKKSLGAAIGGARHGRARLRSCDMSGCTQWVHCPRAPGSGGLCCGPWQERHGAGSCVGLWKQQVHGGTELKEGVEPIRAGGSFPAVQATNVESCLRFPVRARGEKKGRKQKNPRCPLSARSLWSRRLPRRAHHGPGCEKSVWQIGFRLQLRPWCRASRAT